MGGKMIMMNENEEKTGGTTHEKTKFFHLDPIVL